MIYLQMIESEEDKVKFEEIYLKYKALMFYTAGQPDVKDGLFCNAATRK